MWNELSSFDMNSCVSVWKSESYRMMNTQER